MPKRAAEDNEWDLHKDSILQIYIYQKKPLSDVMFLMKERYGFNRTKAQYERIFRKWKIKKNHSADVWKYIASSLKEREAQGRTRSSIQVHDTVISEADAKRQLRRYDYKTTLQQAQAKYRNPSRPNTPPGIVVFTPPADPPPPLAVDLLASSCEIETSIPTPFSSMRILDYANQTPWCRFMQFIQRSKSKDSLIFRGSSDRSVTQGYIDDLMYAKFLEMEQEAPLACLDPEPFLPPTRGTTSTIDITEVLNGTSASSQLELLKMAAYLISNNLDTDRAAKAVVELAEDKRNLSFLQTLFSQKLLIMDASAEILFLRASECNNLPLVKLLLETGVDINIRINMGLLKGHRTALQYAVAESHEKLVTYLLQNGANPNDGQDIYVERRKRGYIFDSLYDLAVGCGNFTIVGELLEYRPEFNYGNPKVTITTLRIAAVQGNLDVFLYLIIKFPKLFMKVQRRPWLLLEPAAFGGSIPTIEFLLDHGFQMNASNRLGHGSALVAASCAGHMHMVRKLLEHGANVNGVGFGAHAIKRTFYVAPLDDSVSKIRSKTALHGALYSRNNKMVRLLLDYGANVHWKSSGRSLVQTCTSLCDLDTLDMLVEAGADVNAVGPGKEPPPLGIALRLGDSGMFERLIRAGAKIPKSGTKEKTWDPLTSAIYGENLDLVHRILEDFESSCSLDSIGLEKCILHYGCDFAKGLLDRGVIDPSSLVDPFVLRSAVRKGNRSFVETLLSNVRAKLNVRSYHYGAAGLIQATEINNIDMVKLLLSAGIKPYDQAWDENATERATAIGTAFQKRAWTIVDTFNMSYIEASSNEERLAWQRAVFNACRLAILRRDLGLIRMMANDFTRTDGVYDIWRLYFSTHSDSALELAFKDMNFNVAKYLLNAGAVPKDPNDDLTSTPLQIAARYNQDALVRQLIDLGVDVNAGPKFEYGATGLQYAAINGNFKIVKILLEAGAKVNAPPAGFDGRTAIEGAAEWGRLDMTRFLLEAGADVQGKTNKNYRRTVYRAWENGHQTVVRMIQAWKKETYGSDDCEDIEMIMETMSKFELHFMDLIAKERWIASLKGSGRYNIGYWRSFLDESDILGLETYGLLDAGETDEWVESDETDE